MEPTARFLIVPLLEIAVEEVLALQQIIVLVFILIQDMIVSIVYVIIMVQVVCPVTAEQVGLFD
jgi:hypothetical protein